MTIIEVPEGDHVHSLPPTLNPIANILITWLVLQAILAS